MCTSTTIFRRVQRRFESSLRVKELLISSVYNGMRRKIVIKGIPWSESRKIYRVGFMVHYNFQFEFAKRRKWTPGNKIKLLGLNWSDLIGYWQWRQPIHCIDSRWKPMTWQQASRDMTPAIIMNGNVVSAYKITTHIRHSIFPQV